MTLRTSAVALALLAAACSGGDTAAPSVIVDTPSCPLLARVVREFGATMRGRSSPYPLGAYFATGGIAAPDEDACGRQIAARLTSLCAQSRGSGWCRNDAPFEACLVGVESVLDDADLCTTCGDGRCAPSEQAFTLEDGTGEWHAVCPEDCACGDGKCDPAIGESGWSCVVDCPVSCGDGLCQGLEICGACEDRPFPLPGCQRCDADCCVTACGDGACIPGAGETRAGCEQDCALGVCGDGYRMGGEDPRTCPGDGWSFHCLDPECRDGAPCADDRQRCGDGVCMGCEMWTCAADCERTGHPVCALGRQACPAGSCGDGACDGTAENMMTCPIDCPREDQGECGDGTCNILKQLYCPMDCVGAEGAAWCGDGVCNPWETVDACADDCAPADPPCAESGACAADRRRCTTVSVTGAVTGQVARRPAVISCEGACDVIEVCRDVCVQDAGAARCVDCGWANFDVDGACGFDAATRCVNEVNLSYCQVDPGAPAVAECAWRRVGQCVAGCQGDRCRPCPAIEACAHGASCDPETGLCVPLQRCGDGVCDEGEAIGAGCGADCDLCGDGRCQEGETEVTCPGDCACRDACYLTGYDRDEHACPQGYAACACGDNRCDAWERADGAWPCPGDCP